MKTPTPEQQEKLFSLLIEYFCYVQDTHTDTDFYQDGWLSNLDADAFNLLYSLGYSRGMN